MHPSPEGATFFVEKNGRIRRCINHVGITLEHGMDGIERDVFNFLRKFARPDVYLSLRTLRRNLPYKRRTVAYTYTAYPIEEFHVE